MMDWFEAYRLIDKALLVCAWVLGIFVVLTVVSFIRHWGRVETIGIFGGVAFCVLTAGCGVLSLLTWLQGFILD